MHLVFDLYKLNGDGSGTFDQLCACALPEGPRHVTADGSSDEVKRSYTFLWPHPINPCPSHNDLLRLTALVLLFLHFHLPVMQDH